LGSKIGKYLQFCGRAHYHVTRKNVESRAQLDEPTECASGGDPLLLYNILHLPFFLLVRILCALRLERRKKIWNFSFFGRGNVSPTHSELCRFVSGSLAKHQVSSPVITLLIFFFVCIGHRDNVFVKCDSIFPLLRCHGVWKKLAHNILFPKSSFRIRTFWGCSKILLSFSMRFDGHF